ncbi:MAG TPA: thiosulfate oxidation carrier protein SoxY [Burkholderiales bacterium]|nr:thiosulfate oxidation carrier protein SoxY [Burkholderiales bacterium]
MKAKGTFGSHDSHGFTRRRALGALAAGATVLLVRPLAATPEALQTALRETFGDRAILPGKVTLELPKLAESGNVVPVTISVDSPMTERDHVKSIHLFAERNHLPRIFEARLGPSNGRARVASRIRLVTSQRVVAAAVMSDESVWSAAFDIEVTVSSCG